VDGIQRRKLLDASLAELTDRLHAVQIVNPLTQPQDRCTSERR